MNRFDPLRKLMHVDEALARFADLPGTVFTDGRFDTLHRDQVAFLAEARQLGARLVVAVAGDRVAPGAASGVSPAAAPSEGDRAFQVAALESVDAVVICADPSPISLLARLRPSVYVKGSGHAMGRLPAATLVHGWGGHALSLPFADDDLVAPRVAARSPRRDGVLAGEPS